MRRPVVMVLTPLLLVGCSGSQATREESAGGAADTLLKACAADRPRAALEVLTPPAKDVLTSASTPLDGCLELLGLRSRVALGTARVVSVHANDLSATAELRAPDGSRSQLELEKSRGVWAVTSAR